MVRTFYFFIFVTFYLTTNPTGTNADCSRNSLRNIQLSSNATLSWDPVPNENCTIARFLVYIKSGDDLEKVYTTDKPPMDVSFLPPCKNTRFVVIPVSPDGIQGSVIHIFADMPVPPNVNLSIYSLRLSHTYEGIMLQWDLEDKWKGCARQYRIVIYDEDTDVAVDRYITTPFIRINDLIPCAPYVFAINTVYNIEEEGPITVMNYVADPARIASPYLEAVTLGTTTVTLSWRLQSLIENRCPVSAVLVNGTPSINSTYLVTDQNSRHKFDTTLYGLQPNIIYILRVTVRNTAGVTSPVVVAVQTLDN